MKINKSQFVGKIENVIKHNKRACCKEKTNELRSNDSEVCELTGMPVCFGTRLCGYEK